MITVDLQDRLTNRHHLIGGYPNIEGHRFGAAAGREKATHQHVKANHTVFESRHKGQIVNFGMHRVITAAQDRDIKLTGQISVS